MIVLCCPVCKNHVWGKDTQYGIRHDCCGLRSWHGKPLVSPATHEARKAAHTAFDPLWKGKPKGTRRTAYKLLAKAMNLPGSLCHISLMNEADAIRVLSCIRVISKQLEERI